MPVENSEDIPSSPQPRGSEGRKLPGDYVTDELEEQTKRFVEEAKERAQRRRQAAEQAPNGPPPPAADGRQRSRRR